jgi:hypothetical protein
MGIMPFSPMGNTVSFVAAVSPPTAVQAQGTIIGATQYRIHNTGNVVVYLGFGSTANAAATMANTAPAGSTLSLVGGGVEIFTLNANQYFTGATATGTAIVNITPGDGA